MNKDQIKNGEARCFPFYKGRYMGDLPLGYSNKKSALKFMKEIPDKDVYERFGGKEEYDRTHEYVGELDRERLYVFNPKRGRNVDSWEADKPYNRMFNGIYDYDGHIYLKDLDQKLVEEMKKDMKNFEWYGEWDAHDAVRGFQEKYGYFPTFHKGKAYVDMDDFEKMKRKMMREEVVFKKGILHITVEYLNEVFE